MADYEAATEQQLAALEILNEVHAAGFTSVFLDSVAVFSGGPLREGGREVRHHMLKIVVNEDSIHAERLHDLAAIADANDARILLDDVRLNGMTFSRICIWPKSDD